MGALATRPGPHRGVAGVRRRHDLADQHADRRTRGPEPGEHQHEHRDQAHADLDHEVGRQRPVGPVRLQEAAVEREEHEEGGRGEDGRDADAALLVQQHGHAVPADEHEDRPRQDEHRALPVHPPGPAAHQVAAPVLVPHGHPPHHGDDHGRPGHGEDQVEARQLVEDAVAVRREEARQRDGEDDAGPVGEDAGRRQRPRLEQPRPHRLDARDAPRRRGGAPRRGWGRPHWARATSPPGRTRRRPRPAATPPASGSVTRWAFAAVSFSMPMWSISGRISRCSS